jgi:hypothetical protein
MTDSGSLELAHTFGSTKRSGPWRVPARVTLRQRMGSSDLDFTAAMLESAEVTLDIDMIGGSIEVRVPDGMHVQSTLRTTLGSYQDHRGVDSGPADSTLVITGRAVWGSVEVRGPKRGHGRRGKR